MTKANKMVVAGLVTAMSLTGMVAIGIGATTNSSDKAGSSSLEAGKPTVITKRKVKMVRRGGAGAAAAGGAAGSAVPVSAAYSGGSSGGSSGGGGGQASVSEATRPVQEVDDSDGEPEFESHDDHGEEQEDD